MHHPGMAGDRRRCAHPAICVPVAIDFNHALTFAQALCELVRFASPPWPQGLLQMALFVGRNAPWLDQRVSAGQALAFVAREN